MERIDDARFDELLDAAIADLPPGIEEFMDNVALFVDDEAPPEAPDILGIYDGIPLTERDNSWGFVPPDTISLFKNNLIAYARDEEHLQEEIRITIVHEIAHHYGIDDERLHELGWG